jgi:hypothetical protein
MDPRAYPAPPKQRRHPGPWIAAAAVLLAAILAWQFYPRGPAPAAPVVAPAPVSAAPAAPESVPAAPEDVFPIAQVPVLPDAPREPLPLLEDSDAAVLDALASWLDGADPRQFVVGTFLLPRLVATVDNLPRATLTREVYVAQPVAGDLVRAQADGRVWLDTANFARYDAHVALFEALDARRVVSTYVSFYPLIQQAYRDLGTPGKQFNDRLVEVIDHLLLAPEPSGPLELVPVAERPRWAFADPRLESASVGHKALVRMGPDHAARVKAKLRTFRELLAGQRPAA